LLSLFLVIYAAVNKIANSSGRGDNHGRIPLVNAVVTRFYGRNILGRLNGTGSGSVRSGAFGPDHRREIGFRIDRISTNGFCICSPCRFKSQRQTSPRHSRPENSNRGQVALF